MSPLARSAIHAAAIAFDTTPEAMLSRSRKRPIAEARWAATALLREHGLSFLQCGRPFGLDHSSVMHGLRVGPTREGWAAKVSGARARMGEPCGLEIAEAEPIAGPRRVYARPIGPPKAPVPKLRSHDDVWAERLAGARFRSIKTRWEPAFRDDLPDCARELGR